jgi:FkbM family methyltransferase
MRPRLPPGFALGRLLLKVRPAPAASLLKRILRIRRLELSTREGRFWVDPASNSGVALAQSGVYDPATLGAIRQLLRPGDTFIDLGANEGYFTVVASRLVGPRGRVLAVEPQTRLEPVLSRNLSLNGCTNVTLVRDAVSDRRGTSVLHLTPDMNNAASGLAAPTRYRIPVQQVGLITLADLLAMAPGAAPVLKMDIESFEHEAIHGSESVFRDGAVRALILELHTGLLRKRGLDAESVPRLLRACGYLQPEGFGGLVWARPAAPPPV